MRREACDPHTQQYRTQYKQGTLYGVRCLGEWKCPRVGAKRLSMWPRVNLRMCWLLQSGACQLLAVVLSRGLASYPRLKAGVAGGVYETMLDSVIGLSVLILVGGHWWEGDDLVEPAHRLGVRHAAWMVQGHNGGTGDECL